MQGHSAAARADVEPTSLCTHTHNTHTFAPPRHRPGRGREPHMQGHPLGWAVPLLVHGGGGQRRGGAGVGAGQGGRGERCGAEGLPASVQVGWVGGRWGEVGGRSGGVGSSGRRGDSRGGGGCAPAGQPDPPPHPPPHPTHVCATQEPVPRASLQRPHHPRAHAGQVWAGGLEGGTGEGRGEGQRECGQRPGGDAAPAALAPHPPTPARLACAVLRRSRW